MDDTMRKWSLKVVLGPTFCWRCTKCDELAARYGSLAEVSLLWLVCSVW